MTKSDDEAKTTHAPGSQPSTRPGSGVPQTITTPTPPVAQTTGPPKDGDLADEGDEGDEAERSDTADGQRTASEGD